MNAVGLNDDYALERYGLREVEGFVAPLVNKAASGRGPVSILFTGERMTPEFREQCREYGLARVAVANECRSTEDWQANWQPTRHPFAFQWGDCFKAAIELKVADFPAEVGFFIDVLGFDANAFQSNYAMLMTPEKDYTFGLVATKPGEAPVDPAAVTLEFMVREIEGLCTQLCERGIEFESCLRAEWGDANPMRTSELRTPNGLRIKLWGFAESTQTE